MRALVSRTPGGPETLQVMDLPIPRVGTAQVRIRVRACGINFPDVLIIEDKYQVRPDRPFAPGLEVAGEIEMIGADVPELSVGDRVMAFMNHGGLAEYATVSAGHCIRVPDAMPFKDAAGMIVTYGTSYHALKDRAQLQPGETLLILGAAGGVGLAAVELGKALGARVVAAVSSEEKAETVRRRGADAVVIYPRTINDPRALSASFMECSPNGIDVIYDPIGGTHCEPALRALGWNGRYLIVGFAGGIPKPPLNLALLKSVSLLGVAWGAAFERDPITQRANLAEVVRLYEAGAIQPVVTDVYSLDRAADAIRLLGERQALGKLVVQI